MNRRRSGTFLNPVDRRDEVALADLAGDVLRVSPVAPIKRRGRGAIRASRSERAQFGIEQLVGGAPAVADRTATLMRGSKWRVSPR